MKILEKYLILSIGLFFIGCGASFDDDEPTSQSFDAQSAIAGTDWAPPANLITKSNGYNIAVAGAGATNCTDGESVPNTPRTAELRSNLLSRYTATLQESQRELGYIIGGGHCRRIKGGSANSVHAVGRALDIFIIKTNGKIGLDRTDSVIDPILHGDARNDLGDPIANFLLENAEELGVQRIIWDRHIWDSVGGHRHYTGRYSHRNHIHVEVSKECQNCTNKLQISLAWTAQTDLDIHIVDTHGTELSPDISDTTASNGGRIVKDCFKGCVTAPASSNNPRTEIAMWEQAPQGRYRVWAENFNGEASANFTISIQYPNGETESRNGTVGAGKDEKSAVFNFDFENNKECKNACSSQATNPRSPSHNPTNNPTTSSTNNPINTPRGEAPPLINARVSGCHTTDQQAPVSLFFLIALVGIGYRPRRKK